MMKLRKHAHWSDTLCFTMSWCRPNLIKTCFKITTMEHLQHLIILKFGNIKNTDKKFLPERILSATDGLMASLTGTCFSSTLRRPVDPYLLLLPEAGERARLLRSLFLLDRWEFCFDGLFGINESSPPLVSDVIDVSSWMSAVLANVVSLSLTTTVSFEDSGLVCVLEEIWIPTVFGTAAELWKII